MLRERDDAYEGYGRCACLCVYDYTVDVAEVAAAAFELRIEQFVTEAGAWREVWAGRLDPAAGSGSVEIDPSSAEPWCSGGSP